MIIERIKGESYESSARRWVAAEGLDPDTVRYLPFIPYRGTFDGAWYAIEYTNPGTWLTHEYTIMRSDEPGSQHKLPVAIGDLRYCLYAIDYFLCPPGELNRIAVGIDLEKPTHATPTT